MSKQRLHHFDVIKGIAILLVVMGHVLIMGIHGIDKAFLFKLIDKIHMPLFFFISGYFTYKLVENKVALPNIWVRFKQLIIPFICVSAIWTLYFPHSGLQSPLSSSFKGLYLDVWKNGYWFTLCLFELILLYYVIVAISNKIRKKYISVLLVLIIYTITFFVSNIFKSDLSNYLSLELVVKFMPIFIFGTICHKYKDKFENALSNNIIFTLSILIGAISLYYTCYFWEFPLIPYYLNIFITIIFQICLIAIAFNVIKAWCQAEYAQENPSWIIRKLQFLGKESLAIYLLHYFFLFPMTWLRQPMIEMGLGFMPLFAVSLIIAIMIIAVTLGVSHIISKSRFLASVLLGKN